MNSIYIVVIVIADRPGIRNVDMVEKVQSKIHKGLQTMLGINHPGDQCELLLIIHKLLYL